LDEWNEKLKSVNSLFKVDFSAFPEMLTEQRNWLHESLIKYRDQVIVRKDLKTEAKYEILDQIKTFIDTHFSNLSDKSKDNSNPDHKKESYPFIVLGETLKDAKISCGQSFIVRGNFYKSENIPMKEVIIKIRNIKEYNSLKHDYITCRI